MFRTLAPVLFGFALMLPPLSHAVDVTTCSQVVPAGETGVLQVDLTTCVSSAVGVFLEDRSVLDLNGHAIASGAIGVTCEGKRCGVHGPGEIHNTRYGILARGNNARVSVEDVNIHDNAIAGIVADHGKPRISVKRVQVTGNIDGIDVIFKGTIKGEDVDASNNSGVGIAAGSRFVFKRLTVLSTGDYGVTCAYGRGKLVDSTVTGAAVADLGTAKRPKVVNTTCGTSRSINPEGTNWHVCQND